MYYKGSIPAGDAQPPFKPSCIGAIGVGGVGRPPEDLEVALVGLKYIKDRLWPDEAGRVSQGGRT